MNFKHKLIIIPNSKKNIDLTKKIIKFLKKNKIEIILPINLIVNKTNKNSFTLFDYSKEARKILSKNDINQTDFLYNLMSELLLDKIYYIYSENLSFSNLKKFYQNEVLYEHKYFNNYRSKFKQNNTIYLKNKKIFTIGEHRKNLIKDKNYLGLVVTFLNKHITQYTINEDKRFFTIYVISVFYKGVLKFIYKFYKFIFFKKSHFYKHKDFIILKYYLKIRNIQKNYNLT